MVKKTAAETRGLTKEEETRQLAHPFFHSTDKRKCEVLELLKVFTSVTEYGGPAQRRGPRKKENPWRPVTTHHRPCWSCTAVSFSSPKDVGNNCGEAFNHPIQKHRVKSLFVWSVRKQRSTNIPKYSWLYMNIRVTTEANG